MSGLGEKHNVVDDGSAPPKVSVADLREDLPDDPIPILKSKDEHSVLIDPRTMPTDFSVISPVE